MMRNFFYPALIFHSTPRTWKPVLLLTALLTCVQMLAIAQVTDNTRLELTLDKTIEYAIKNQPRIQQSSLDEQITESIIRSRLADWYPQVNFNYNLQHNFLLQTSVFGGNQVRLGVNNTSGAQFTATQTIFNRDVLLARRTKNNVQLQTTQTTVNNKIDLAVNVTRAFYDVLATMQQIKLADENINRLRRSLKDATAQYKVGIADKIDYKRATISLNNSLALKHSNEALLAAKNEYLKSLMAYPAATTLTLVYDSTSMESDAIVDTLQVPDYHNRIEYRLLETQQSLLKANVLYNKWSYLPSVSANGAYNLNFQNNQFTKLYGTSFPNSYANLTLGVPLFQGGKRKANMHTAELQLSRNDLDLASLKNTVNAQYAQALATYKSSLATYLALKENVILAKEVYDIIQLQYRSGIKTYLEVITSQADLQAAQINYFNSLYQLLSVKADVRRALGQITY